MNTPTATEQNLQSTLDVSYRNKNPLRTLWQLFNGRHAQLLLVAILYIIKTSPMIVLPIVTGNMITQITAVYAAHQAGHGGAERRLGVGGETGAEHPLEVDVAPEGQGDRLSVSPPVGGEGDGSQQKIFNQHAGKRFDGFNIAQHLALEASALGGIVEGHRQLLQSDDDR